MKYLHAQDTDRQHPYFQQLCKELAQSVSVVGGYGNTTKEGMNERITGFIQKANG
jgi:hypothetical protein